MYYNVGTRQNISEHSLIIFLLQVLDVHGG